jgi:20S proteasome alpha/beta subunit
LTLLVGICCADGVVIAADQQATHGAVGQPPTIAQAIVKPQIIGGQAVYAFSGPVSVGQQIAAKITDLQPQFGGTKCAAMIPKIQAAIRDVLNPAFETAASAAKVMGQQLALQDVLCGSLLAAKFSDGIRLLDISPQGSCEILTPEKIACVCLGSGKPNGDPILRFLWNVYWKDQPPTLREATLAAYWTIQIAIELKTIMVGYETDVFVLEKHGAAGKHVRAHRLEADRLEEHNGFINAVRAQMRAVRDQMLLAPGTPEPPPPPEPPKTG